jgi:hypothetical protein
VKEVAKLANPFASPISFDSPKIWSISTPCQTCVTIPTGLPSTGSHYSEFAVKTYNLSADQLIAAMRSGKQDRYEVLAAYAKFLKKEKMKTSTNVRKSVSTLREMLEFHSVELND